MQPLEIQQQMEATRHLAVCGLILVVVEEVEVFPLAHLLALEAILKSLEGLNLAALEAVGLLQHRVVLPLVKQEHPLILVVVVEGLGQAQLLSQRVEETVAETR
jgi:hypothetical protein